jgi:hypothetical protein
MRMERRIRYHASLPFQRGFLKYQSSSFYLKKGHTSGAGHRNGIAAGTLVRNHNLAAMTTAARAVTLAQTAGFNKAAIKSPSVISCHEPDWPKRLPCPSIDVEFGDERKSPTLTDQKHVAYPRKITWCLTELVVMDQDGTRRYLSLD